MTKFTTFANDVLDMEYGGWAAAGYTAGTTSIVQLGGTPYTYPVKMEFTTTVSVAATPGTVFSGGSYPAGGITLVGAVPTTGAASGSKTNSSGAITATNMPAGTWADAYTHDSTGTPKPMNFRGGASLAKTVNSGDTCSVPISSFTGTET